MVDDVGVFQAVVGQAADIDLMGAVAPPVKPISVSRASPGPLTTQPMTDTVSGVVMCARRPLSRSTVLMTSNCWRAQDGQGITVTPRRRRFNDFTISKPALTSSTGSALQRDTRIEATNQILIVTALVRSPVQLSVAAAGQTRHK